ncbi:hypothetical protein [Umezawaea tangerina]|uniref:ATP-grasp domain-containing protein n=1 Tax=Umezawaea tangerina TaxID=84725 RepID=A0A2T0SVW3_9PSEU|nr:hypothetical protein [Umezawaea tangerina]PRY37530.1 hypothetical protein CLV43_110342 [Umezawaea tangerina]
MTRTAEVFPPARLLLVHPEPPLVRKALRAGLDVRVLLDEARRAEDYPLPEDRVTRVCGGPETEEVVRRLVGEDRVTHVLDGEGRSLPEPLPGVGAAADELFRRELFPNWRKAVGDRTFATVDEVRKVVGDLGWRAVIHTDLGEVVVWSEDDVDGWVRLHGGRSGPFAVERLASDVEVVVSTLTVDGMHRVVGITERLPKAGVLSYAYPASLAELRTVQVRATVTSMLDLVGHEFGPALTRVAMTGPEPRVLRSRACFSVDRISDLIEVATGFDVQTELFRALAGALVQAPRPRWFAAALVFRLPGSPVDGPGSCVLAEGVSPEVALARLDEERVLPE